MSKDKHIDNISEKVWSAYFSGVILTSDKERVEAFLKQYPELEEEFKGISSIEVSSIGVITKNVNNRIKEKVGVRKFPVLWVGMVATIAIIAVVIFNSSNKKSSTIAGADVKEKNVAVLDSADTQIADSDQLDEEESIDDTMFFFERKGGDVSVVELLPVQNRVFDLAGKEEEPSDIVFIEVKEDANIVEPEKKEIIVPSETYTKSFTTSVDYRQTVYVEDNFYSQSKTMGKTTSYASPIKGYSYEMEGMPNFKGSDDELLDYINDKLSSDELLAGKTRKMRASLSFVVTNKGKVKDVLVQNCNHKQFGMSLMQIMENMPDWNPSEFKGKKGKAHYVLKITFE